MYHSFLIHLSADGHLGSFHVLAIINSAVMNIGVHVFNSGFLSVYAQQQADSLPAEPQWVAIPFSRGSSQPRD